MNLRKLFLKNETLLLIPLAIAVVGEMLLWEFFYRSASDEPTDKYCRLIQNHSIHKYITVGQDELLRWIGVFSLFYASICVMIKFPKSRIVIGIIVSWALLLYAIEHFFF